VGGAQSFRATVQPLVRDAAARDASVNDLARSLRAIYGHAYRRADMLVDLRVYRVTALAPQIDQPSGVSEMLNSAVAIGQAMPRYFDFR